MLLYNLIEYSDNYSQASKIFCQYYGNTLGDGDNGAITDSKSFKSKVKIRGKVPTNGNTKDLEITVP